MQEDPQESINYFLFLKSQFAKAANASANDYEFYFNVFDISVKISLANNALFSPLTKAFSHLQAPATSHPDIHICAWDSESTGVGLPPPPWSLDEYGSHGQIDRFVNEKIHTVFHIGPSALSVIDKHLLDAVYCIPTAQHFPYFEYANPFKTILHLALEKRETYFTHAAAIGTEDGVALIVGKSGSGKSTTAVSALSSGLKFISDDYCLLRDYQNEVFVHSLYQTAKICWDTLEKIPSLKEQICPFTEPEHEKAIMEVAEKYPEQIISKAPLRAVYIPKLGNSEETTFSPTRGADILKAIAPSTVFQLPGAGGKRFSAMSRMTSSVPGYHVHLSSDPVEASEAIKRHMSQEI